MKALHLVDSISRHAGGVAEVVRSLTRSLAEVPDTVVAVESIVDDATDADRPAWAPVPVTAHPATGPRRFGFSRELSLSLSGSDAELLHVHAIWQGQSAAVNAAHRRSGIPYLISPHGMLDPWALRNSAWKKRIASVLYEATHLRHATAFHALAASERDVIRAYGIRQPVCVIPNGVDLPALEASTEKSRRKTLLFLGRLHPKKGLVEALRAWKVSRHPDWRWIIAGWGQGDHPADLETLGHELELDFAKGADAALDPEGPSLVFSGPVFGAAKEALYRQADAFILPSHSEGLPMAVLEAWSYQLPVVMTPACNLPEGFAADAAIRIEAQTGSISEGLRELFEMNPADLAAMGDAGRRLVEDRFTWPKVAARMREVYAWMMGGERPSVLGS